MKLKNKLLLTSALAVTALAPTISVSCNFYFNANEQAKQYDLSLAMMPISSLNYLRFPTVAKILPSLVEGPVKASTTEEIKQMYSLPEFKLNFYEMGTAESLDDFNTKPEDQEKLTSINTSASYYNIAQYFTAGNIATDNGGDRAVTSIVNANQLSLSTRIGLNKGSSKWSNGDEINAQSYRDSVEYILDISTGSQLLTNFLTNNFKGAQNMVDVQQEYQRMFSRPYINPFGRTKYTYDNTLKLWRQDIDGKYLDANGKDALIYDYQAATKKAEDGKVYLVDSSGNWLKDKDGNRLTQQDEKKYIDKIKAAAKGLAFYTGQRFLDFSNKYIESQLSLAMNDGVELLDENGKIKDKITLKVQENALGNDIDITEITIKANPNFDPRQRPDWRDPRGQFKPYADDKYDLRFEFEETSPMSLNGVIGLLDHNILIPINRRFVENEAGGILNFGNKLENFLTSGPFTISDLQLGAQGSIELVKNEQYYDIDRVIPRKIKIYFNDNPIVLVNLFKSGYLSAADMPSVMHLDFWSNPKYKKYLTKSSGYGTIGFQYNIDPNSAGNPLLQDQNLRNSIAYAIDRHSLINLVGWQASFPVINWTAFNVSRSVKGIPLEAYFESVNVKAKNDSITPIQNYAFIDHLAKNYNFENISRVDKMFNLDTAKYYLELFKKDHPDVKNVTLKYIYDGSKEKEYAGLALKNQIESAFDGFITIELKSYPVNTYSQYRSEGNFDITYYNFDFLGSSFDSYIRAFLQTDEINKKDSKTLGFQKNPSGAWTYENYFKNFDKQRENLNTILGSQPYNLTVTQINELAKKIEKLNEIWVNIAHQGLFDSSTTKYEHFSKLLYSFESVNEITVEFLKPLYTKKDWELLTNTTNLNNIIEQIKNALSNILNIKQEIATLLPNTVKTLFDTSDKISDFHALYNIFKTDETPELARQRLHISALHWEKIKNLAAYIEIRDPKTNEIRVETKSERSDRISLFFSQKFTDEELDQNWTETEIFKLIVSFEKILRDSSPVVPLMEVDTKWMVSHVGGVRSIFTFALQYAYDVTHPPLPNLSSKLGSE